MDKEKDIESVIVELKRKKAREWRKNNKDKIKEINRRYWLKKAQEIINEKNKEEE